MIVALVALFVSLAGNASAVTFFVTSKQIKDKTIQLRDISPAARWALRGSQGAQGPQGFTGPRGFTGLQGPTGPAGKSFDPYKIETDLSELCRGIRGTQNALSPSLATYLYPDFRYKSCLYFY
jgi:hypothetical protein